MRKQASKRTSSVVMQNLRRLQNLRRFIVRQLSINRGSCRTPFRYVTYRMLYIPYIYRIYTVSSLLEKVQKEQDVVTRAEFGLFLNESKPYKATELPELTPIQNLTRTILVNHDRITNQLVTLNFNFSIIKTMLEYLTYLLHRNRRIFEIGKKRNSELDLTSS